MSAELTPGPIGRKGLFLWQLDSPSGSGINLWSGQLSANNGYSPRHAEQAARLFVAAPDLAAALRGLMELTRPMFVVQTSDGVVTHPAYAAGLAALAKVEGEQSHE